MNEAKAARNVDDLKAAWRNGHRAPTSGFYHAVHPFSQHHASPFIVNDVYYHTAEHYMMAAKARLFDDRSALERILNTRSPQAAKQIGRNVDAFDEEAWRNVRENIIYSGNLAKFGQNSRPRDELLSTKRHILAEASRHDLIYGIGHSIGAPSVHDPLKWRGLNLLGFALMNVRATLRL